MADRAQTILVIEDDPAVAEALVEGIGTEGYARPLGVDRGREASRSRETTHRS